MGMNGYITLVSNKGTGSSRKVQIVTGMTIKEVIYAELGLKDPAKYLVLLNAKKCTEFGTKLKDGDFVNIIPTDVKGNAG